MQNLIKKRTDGITVKHYGDTRYLTFIWQQHRKK